MQWEKVETADGSPTLSIDGGEKMHSMEGALSESLFIYKSCIDRSALQESPKILSLGLGLGYNELIAVATSIIWKKPIKVCSFEKLDFLRDNFTGWLNKKSVELGSIYDQVLHGISQEFAQNKSLLFETTVQMYESQHLEIRGAFEEKNPWPWKFHGICYDAYSSETDPELWKEEFLEKSLESYADDSFCCLSTYAATGNLKRALKNLKFDVEIRKGFGMKRNSTFAIRSQA